MSSPVQPAPPRFSFVVMAYNQEGFIRDAVRGALAQRGAPLEIILSDDASPDRTFEIMREEADAYDGPHRVVLNRNPRNLGLIPHFNQLFQMCSSEVMIYSAGDDISHPDRSARIAAAFERPGTLLVHSHVNPIDGDGRPAEFDYSRATFLHGTDLAKAAASDSLYVGATAAYHKDLIRRFGPITELRTYEDLTLGFRACLIDPGGIVFIDAPLVDYRIGLGLTHQPPKTRSRLENRRRRLRILESARGAFRQRRRDALHFGIEPGASVIADLENREEMIGVRADALNGLKAVMANHGRQPRRALKAWGSEWNRILRRR